MMVSVNFMHQSIPAAFKPPLALGNLPSKAKNANAQA